MTLSYIETKNLLDLVLKSPPDQVRILLHTALNDAKRTEGEFYDGLVKHGPGMNLSTEEWFDILIKLPNRILRSQLNLENLLSEEHQRRLPPVTG